MGGGFVRGPKGRKSCKYLNHQSLRVSCPPDPDTPLFALPDRANRRMGRHVGGLTQAASGGSYRALSIGCRGGWAWMSQVAPSAVWNIRAAVPAIQLSFSPVKLTLTVSGVGRVWEHDAVDRNRFSGQTAR